MSNESRLESDNCSLLEGKSKFISIPDTTPKQTCYGKKCSGGAKPRITSMCCVCRAIKKSVWLCHPIFTFLVCSKCYVSTCRKGEDELVMPRLIVQKSCAICKAEFYCHKSGVKLIKYIECSRCILRFCLKCLSTLLTMNRHKLKKLNAQDWMCFRCDPNMMHLMLKDADMILTRQLKTFISKQRCRKRKQQINFTEYNNESFSIQSGLLLIESNKVDSTITHRGNIFIYSSTTPLEKQYKHTNNLNFHPEYKLELRDRIHLKPHQIDSIKFLYERVISPIEEWHKTIQSGTGDSCALAQQDCFERRRTIVVFLKALLNSKYSTTTKVLIIIDRRDSDSWTRDLQFFLPESMFTIKSVFCNNFYKMFNMNPDFSGWGVFWSIALIDYSQYITEISRPRSLLTSIDGPTITVFDNYDLLVENCPYFELCAHQIYTKKKIFLSHSQIFNPKELHNAHLRCVSNSDMFWKGILNSRLFSAIRIKNVRTLFERLRRLNTCKKRVKNRRLKRTIIVKQIISKVIRSVHQLSIGDSKPKLLPLYEFHAFLNLTFPQMNLYNYLLKFLVENKLNLSTYLPFLRRILLHPCVLVSNPTIEVADQSNNNCRKPTHLVYNSQINDVLMLKKTVPHNLITNCISRFENIQDKIWSTKVEFLIRILNVCSAKNIKVAIFSKEETFFEYFETALTNLFQITLRGSKAALFSCGVNRWKNGVNYYRIHPSKLTFKAKNFINNFNNIHIPTATLCLVNVIDNMPDINLTGASLVVCMEPMNQLHYLRCVASAYRADQTNVVTVITMASKSTFEDFTLKNSCDELDSVLENCNSKFLNDITPKSYVDLSSIPFNQSEARFPADHFLSSIKPHQCGVTEIRTITTYK